MGENLIADKKERSLFQDETDVELNKAEAELAYLLKQDKFLRDNIQDSPTQVMEDAYLESVYLAISTGKFLTLFSFFSRVDVTFSSNWFGVSGSEETLA